MEVFGAQTDYSHKKRFFEIKIRTACLSQVDIQTPLQRICVHGTDPEERFDPAVWAVAEALITFFNATLLSGYATCSGKNFYRKLLRSDADQPIRKFGKEQIVQVAGSYHEAVRHAKKAQLIVPEEGWSSFVIKDMGSWEGYVVETALSMHEGSGLPKVCMTMLKDKKESPYIARRAKLN